MLKIVNTNKHEYNGTDGGRTHKMRHISRIKTFKRGSEAVKPLCKDLFNAKNSDVVVPELPSEETPVKVQHEYPDCLGVEPELF